MPTTPLKRPSPSDSSDGGNDESSAKRRRTGSYFSPIPRAESVMAERGDTGSDLATAEIQVTSSENEGMDISLKRSIALALKHVGFESASKEALESFMLLVDTYISQILSGVLLSMTTCRRTLPIPQDYQYAFEEMQIDLSSLVPHTKLPHGLPPVRPQYEPQEPLPPPYVDNSVLLGLELSGVVDMASKKYIPAKFPIFPAIRTYKHTEYYVVNRDGDDAAKIRERGAQDRRDVEKLLHQHLNQSTQLGRRRTVSSNQSERAKKTEKLWRLAMGDSGSEDTAMEAKVVVVNAARKYGRKVRPVTKKVET